MSTPQIAIKQKPIIGLLFVLAAALGFSTKAIIIKLAYAYGSQITPIMLLALRMAMSLPFFLAAIIILQRDVARPALSNKDYLQLAGLGVIGFYLAAYFDFLGLFYISASLERLILLLYPTLVVILSAIFLRRPISTKEVLSLIVSYAGIIIVFYEELSLAGSNVILGSALVLASATAFAIYLMGSGQMVRRLGAMRFTAYAMSIACIATLIHFSVDYDAQVFQLPMEVYGLALLMAVVSTVIPAFFMNAGIHHLGASPAAIISAMGPIMTIFLAYLILDEQLTFIQIIGAGFMMAGVFIVSANKKK
jgi:drug/metabolite transporter (DMT)-like permease